MFTYNELTIAVVVVLGAIAAFNMFTAAVKGWKELRQPDTELKETVDEHDRKLLNDHERINDLSESNDLQALVLLQIANHLIDGNHSGQLIEARDNLQAFLVKRRR